MFVFFIFVYYNVSFFISRPIVVHCSPGTGRTGTIIACAMAMHKLKATSKPIVDMPQILHHIRQGRAGAVQTKEQYEYIYKVASDVALQ